MTLVAVFSDPHANARALRAVLDDMDAQGADARIGLGDIIGYGPNPSECVEMMRASGIESVMGNHEQALIGPMYLNRLNQIAQDVIVRTRQMLTERQVAWLVSRPKSLVRYGMRFVHGCPPADTHDYLIRYENDVEALFRLFGEPVCFVGHTHMLHLVREGGEGFGPLGPEPVVLEPDRRWVVNVGAVGQPRDGTPEAKYVLFDTETRTLTPRAVPYDAQKTADEIIALGFHRGLATRLL